MQGAAGFALRQAFRVVDVGLRTVSRGSVRRVVAVPPSLPDDLERVVGKLRHATSARLRAPLVGPYASRAQAARTLAQVLATATQGIEDADQSAMPVWRTIPRLDDLAVGDQVRVLAHDLLAALATSPALVWVPDGPAAAALRVTAAELVRTVAAAVTVVDSLL
jgi:hypothetical protein